jgi:hypothetical protein
MKEGTVRQVGYLERLYRDVRSTEHKVLTTYLYRTSATQHHKHASSTQFVNCRSLSHPKRCTWNKHFNLQLTYYTSVCSVLTACDLVTSELESEEPLHNFHVRCGQSDIFRRERERERENEKS